MSVQTVGPTTYRNAGGIEAEDSRTPESKIKRTLKKRPKAVTTLWISRATKSFDVVELAADSLEWKLLNGSHRTCADILWINCGGDTDCCMRKILKIIDIRQTRRRTRFPAVGFVPGMPELCSKSNTAKLLERARFFFPSLYSFVPQTFHLPENREHLRAFIKLTKRESTRHSSITEERRSTFIIKPEFGSQGDGIYLTQNTDDLMRIPYAQNCVVQKYVTDPLLLPAPVSACAGKNGNVNRKFDLRVYVLVASLSPFRVYLCEEGLARFCTEVYKPPTAANIKKVFMHLTNYSLNKRSKEFVHERERSASDSDNSSDGELSVSVEPRQSEGSSHATKRKMSEVLAECAAHCPDLPCTQGQLWRSIQECIARAFLAMESELRLRYGSFGRALNETLRRRRETYGKNSVPVKGAAAHNFFHIVGVDVLLDSSGKPHILELNNNPSFSITHEQETAPGVVEYCSSPVDEFVKEMVTRDALEIVQREREITRQEGKLMKRVQRQQRTEGDEVGGGGGAGLTGGKEKNTGGQRRAGEAKEHFPRPISHGSYELIIGTDSPVYDRQRQEREELTIFEGMRMIFERIASRSGSISSGKFCRIFTQVTNLTSAELDILYLKLLTPTHAKAMRFDHFCQALIRIVSIVYDESGSRGSSSSSRGGGVGGGGKGRRNSKIRAIHQLLRTIENILGRHEEIVGRRYCKR